MAQPMLKVIKTIVEYKRDTKTFLDTLVTVDTHLFPTPVTIKKPISPVDGNHGFTSLPSWEYVEYLEGRLNKTEASLCADKKSTFLGGYIAGSKVNAVHPDVAFNEWFKKQSDVAAVVDKDRLT